MNGDSLHLTVGYKRLVVRNLDLRASEFVLKKLSLPAAHKELKYSKLIYLFSLIGRTARVVVMLLLLLLLLFCFVCVRPLCIRERIFLSFFRKNIF